MLIFVSHCAISTNRTPHQVGEKIEMMEYEISEMKIEDYDEAMALWQSAEGIGLRDSDNRKDMESFLERNPRMSLVARKDQKIIGTLLCGHDGRRGYLYHLSVAPPQRLRGIGKALVEKCLSQLHAEGIQKCHVFILKNNKEGHQFWKIIGWKERRDIQVMSKEIMK